MNPNKLDKLTKEDIIYLRRYNGRYANWMLKACGIIEDYADEQQVDLSITKTPTGWKITWDVNGNTGSTQEITMQEAIICAAREIHNQNHANPPWRQPEMPIFE